MQYTLLAGTSSSVAPHPWPAELDSTRDDCDPAGGAYFLTTVGPSLFLVSVTQLRCVDIGRVYLRTRVSGVGVRGLQESSKQ